MYGQLCSYLKLCFVTRLQDMAQNSFFPDVIKREAIKSSGQRPLSEQPSWLRYCTENYSGLLKNLLPIISSYYEADCLQENFLFNKNMHGRTRCYPNTVVLLLEPPRDCGDC